jgi:probable rRNA maturation factor
MNRVEVNAGEVPLPAWADAVHDYSLKVLGELGKDNWDLSILLCNDACIQSLNARYRHTDEATDVLSFELGTEIEGEEGETRYAAGDIVISLETLGENARYFKTTRDEELRRLLIHGILHLNGMDHKTNDNTEPMLRIQEAILTRLAGESIMPAQAAS